MQRLNLWINMELSGAPIIDNYLVMTYMQFRDPERLGRYQSFTCATYHWRHRRVVPKWYEVKNFYGSEEFSQSEEAYDHFAKDDYLEDGPWRSNSSDPES